MRFLQIVNKAAEVQSFSDKVSLALTTVIVGMLTVFAVMLIIMLVISLIGKIFEARRRNQKAKTDVKVAENTADSAPVSTESAQAEENQNVKELVVAITAAIAVYTEQPAGSFRVVSFRKTSAKPAWNKK